MADLVSPGILVQEKDLTNTIPPVGGSSGGIAAAFAWGPAEEITTITSESNLVNTFGKPNSDVQANWLVASSYLAYAGNLGVVRTVGSSAYNGNDSSGSAIESADVVAGGAGLTDVNTTDIDAGIFVVGNTGVGRGFKIDTNVTDGVITAVDNPTIPTTSSPNVAYVDGTFYVGVVGGNSDAVLKLVVADTSTTQTIAATVAHGGTGYLSANDAAVTEGNDGDPSKITNVNLDTDETEAIAFESASLAADHDLNNLDLLVITTGSEDAVLRITGLGGSTLQISNTSDFNSTSIASSAFLARYPGSYGNNIGVKIFKGTSGQFTTATDFSNNFDAETGTSAYVAARGNQADEIHVLVYDKTGEITGTADTVLEKFAHLSLCTDAKDSFGASNYIKDVLYNTSQYIYFGGTWGTVGNAIWNNKQAAGTVALTDIATTGTATVVWTNGADDYSNSNGSTARLAGYEKFADKETVDVSFLIGGVGETSTLATGDTIASKVTAIVNARKDAVGFVSPPKSTGGSDITSPSVTLSTKNNVVSAWQDLNSSYVVVDSGWKKAYNRYTDTYVPIPLNGDTAGLTALTELTNDAWWSPAGYNRGNVRNVYELYYNPDQAGRDKLYKAGVNPVVSFPGQGVILFGDKTSQKKPSAFYRINVRRLFIHIEKAISEAAKFFMFEFNDEFTRSQFRSMVEPFLRGIKAKRGIFDYQVVCDSTNNTGDVIDRNEFVGDIYIKPARSINFIRLNFIAVRTGVDFSEIAG